MFTERNLCVHDVNGVPCRRAQLMMRLGEIWGLNWAWYIVYGDCYEQ